MISDCLYILGTSNDHSAIRIPMEGDARRLIVAAFIRIELAAARCERYEDDAFGGTPLCHGMLECLSAHKVHDQVS